MRVGLLKGILSLAVTILDPAPRSAELQESRGIAGLASRPGQNWLGHPTLPAPFDVEIIDEEDGADGLEWTSLRAWTPPVSSPLPPLGQEQSFPSLMSVLDLESWRSQNDLQRLKQVAGDAAFGLPMLLPQLLLEEFLPRGVSVG